MQWRSPYLCHLLNKVLLFHYDFDIFLTSFWKLSDGWNSRTGGTDVNCQRFTIRRRLVVFLHFDWLSDTKAIRRLSKGFQKLIQNFVKWDSEKPSGSSQDKALHDNIDGQVDRIYKAIKIVATMVSWLSQSSTVGFPVHVFSKHTGTSILQTSGLNHTLKANFFLL